jgi:Flp pilus assembly protein TadG
MAALRAPIWHRFWRDRRGVVAIAVAVLLPVLIGFVGLGVEVGLWFAIQRQNQSAADAAAISAALEYAAQIQSNVATNPSAAATAAAGYNLFNNANCSTSGTTNCTLSPCYGFTVGSSCTTSNPNGTLPDAVQVVLTQPLSTTFANLVTAIWGPNLDTVNVTTTAIAAFPVAGRVCYLALDARAANAFLVDSGGTLPNRNCWAASNSSSGSALYCNGCTIAGPTNVVGGDAVSNSGQLKGSPNRSYASPIADPYAGIAVGPMPSCHMPDVVVHGGAITPKDRYCQGIQVDGTDGWTLTMSPGVYYVDKQFGIQNGATLSADGVTIIINGQIYVGPSAMLTIIAPTAGTAGPFPGIAIFGPSALPVIQDFAGISHIQGAIYFPSQTIQFDSTSQLDPSLCTQIIGAQIHIKNNAGVSANCSGTGVAPIPILEVYLSL